MSIEEYVPVENWNDNSKWTDAIMQAFSDNLTDYLNNTLVAAFSTQYANFGIVPAQISNPRDTITITTTDGIDLNSATQAIALPSDTSAGLEETIVLSAAIAKKISGAHWGLGTKGNVSSAILRGGFINDGGAVPALWIGLLGNRTTVSSANCFATLTSVTAPEHLLVTRTITNGTWPIKEFFYFYADFNDTGDIWTVSNTPGNIVVGDTADGKWQPYNPVYTGFSVNPVIDYYRWTQIGQTIFLEYENAAAGTSNDTVFTIQAPAKSARTQNHNPVLVMDNGTVSTGVGRLEFNATSQTISIFKDMSGAAFTNSGSKLASFKTSYEVYYG